MKGGIVSLLLVLVFFGCKDESSKIGDEHFKKGKYKEAISAYDEYLRLNPAHVKSLYNRGRAYEELGQVDKAMADFQVVLKQDPKNVNALMSIGKDAFYRRSDFEKARYYFDEALKYDAESVLAYTFRGKSHQRLGELEEAMSDFNSAISIDKDYGEAYFSRGALKVVMEQHKAACSDFKKAQGLGIMEAGKVIGKYCH